MQLSLTEIIILYYHQAQPAFQGILVIPSLYFILSLMKGNESQLCYRGEEKMWKKNGAHTKISTSSMIILTC
jgi:hypothetical protein